MESNVERGIRVVLNLQGVLHLALQIKREVHQMSADLWTVSREVTVEETLVGESSLESSSSEGEEGVVPEMPGVFHDARDDFFAGL